MLSHHERKNMAISKSGLPQKVLELFDPRVDLAYLPPVVTKKATLPQLPVATYVRHFPDPDDPEYAPVKTEAGQLEDRKFRCAEYAAQVSIEVPSILERREKKAEASKTIQSARLEAALSAYDPKSDTSVTSDPMRTLFVSRIEFTVDEAELTKHFQEFGPIASVRIVKDASGKSRGYGFVEFEHQGDMKSAYKALPNGKKIHNRRLCVDVERGRTVPDWKPMRLGGGKGGESRVAREKFNKYDKSQAPPMGQRMPERGPERPMRDTRAPRDDRDRDRDSRPPRDSRAGRDDRAPSYDRSERSSRPPRENGGLPPPPRTDDRERERRGTYAVREDRDRDDRRGRDDRMSGYDRDRRGGGGGGDKRERRDDDRDRDDKRARYDDRNARY